MANDSLQMPHALTLKERKTLTMTGVTEVISFDDASVVLHTALGKLKTLTLDGGQVAVEGSISALIYEEPRQGGWLRRLMG